MLGSCVGCCVLGCVCGYVVDVELDGGGWCCEFVGDDDGLGVGWLVVVVGCVLLDCDYVFNCCGVCVWYGWCGVDDLLLVVFG